MQWPCLKLRVVCSMTQHPPCLHQAWGWVGKQRRLAERPWGEGAPAIHVTLLQSVGVGSLSKRPRSSSKEMKAQEGLGGFPKVTQHRAGLRLRCWRV